MKKIMDFIEEETNGTSYHTFKYGLEAVSVPRLEYDDDEWWKKEEQERQFLPKNNTSN